MQLEKVTKMRRSRRQNGDMTMPAAAAHGLDLIGERWAMPVIRELLLGPRRFSRPENDLPGISANVLTQRLDGAGGSGRAGPPQAAAARVGPGL